MSLPGLFSDGEAVALEMLGYRFDPYQQLAQSKERQGRYARENVGEIVGIIDKE